MSIHPQLLAWQCRALRPTFFAALPAGLLVLLTREPLFDQRFLPALFIALHGMTIVRWQGRPEATPMAFLYSRGYSRDDLWASSMLASLAAAAAAWLPAALLIWTRARSLFQDRAFLNPLYPLMAPREVMTPVYWLAFYLFILPPLHYEWIRRAQPVRSPDSGAWVTMALLVAIFTVLNAAGYGQYESAWFVTMLWSAGGALSLLMLLAGWRLHRRMEVRQ